MSDTRTITPGDLVNEAIGAGFLEERTVALIAGWDVEVVDAAEDITVEVDDEGDVRVTLTEGTPDYEVLIRQRIGDMDPAPDELYNTNFVRIGRWGRIIAWTDGPRAGVSPYDTTEQAKEAFLVSMREDR